MDEINLSTEQVIYLMAVLIPILVYLINKLTVVNIEMDDPEEAIPETNLRYLQINTYYGG
ncbi:hypothetical protein BN1356_00946 [Streptococcus varani]|uniref:Uncharacterized protein n=1 Tax=Streptococcus varani TaxID=1608583 RepID=A0A0E4H3N2_9STRE|nr:hypothetical protein [Streptococcus varani]CQR24602.1 hypothetical protein BN1356_00946 [Streptococcus varani]